ncbi:hypothetical protein A3862_20360 [Methylobacterium sp. XJLW]|nr:hypothetical protein A3862_20360 [Methylobacterium sp. XJLW]
MRLVAAASVGNGFLEAFLGCVLEAMPLPACLSRDRYDDNTSGEYLTPLYDIASAISSRLKPAARRDVTVAAIRSTRACRVHVLRGAGPVA